MANQVLGQPVQGNTSQVGGPNGYTFQTGQISIAVGTYAYTYNDSSPSAEGFSVQIPRTDSTEPYSVVQSTITGSTGTSFGRVLGTTAFGTSATATAAHRPRDVMVIMDLSGSMRLESTPGAYYSGSTAYPEFPYMRNLSLNPDSNFPQFGHYSDKNTAALQGSSSSYLADLGVTADPSNISSTTNSGPPIVQDFYANAVGSAPASGSGAFSSAPAGYTTTPGGDTPLKTSLNAGGGYAQTVAQFNNNSTTTNATFETGGYAAYTGSSFKGYTQGPGYWGKTFWIWPPCPQPVSSAVPTLPSALSASFNWSNANVTDWRQRFFVG